MTGIYIGSTVPRSGKSLLSFSLGVLLQKAGYSVGYMKPLGRIPQKKDELLGDADALVVQEVLGQNAPADVVSPVMIPGDLHALAVREDDRDAAMRRICAAYEQISAGKDFTLVSGSASFPATGRFCHADGLRVLRTLGLKILFVERFTGRFNYDALLFLKDLLGPDLLGIVFNDVPDEEARDAARLLVPYLRERGVSVLGIIGREPGLAAMRVTELAQGLNGHIVAGNAHASRMVDSFLIGTMQVDNVMLHLRQRSGCAVIVGGDRADVQLVAIEGNCPCLVLTGNLFPNDIILSRADTLNVPIVMVRQDTYTIAKKMEALLNRHKMRDVMKIRQGAQLISNNLDFIALRAGLGI